MIKEIRLPEISENVESGEVIEVLVSEGDVIDEDQSIVELETEKAAFEVPSPFGGKVTEISVARGNTIKVGEVILKVETGSEGEKHTLNTERREETEETQQLEVTGKNAGIETLKTKNSKDEKDEKDEEPEKRRNQEGKQIPASPTVRHRARELGIDLKDIAGSGPGGRIRPEDVEKYGSIVSGEKKEPGGISSDEDLPDFTRWGEIERTSMSGIRRVTAKNVARAWTTVPQVTQFDRADVTHLELFRKKNSKIVNDRGGKLTVTSIVLKVCAEALKKFPQFNTSLDISKKEIIYKKYVNIGVAVDTERGLIVPVLKNADAKGILEISVELTELVEKARNKQISPDELQGGNFTISNLGGIGGTNFTPIVYAPQAAILGISRANMEQLYTGKEFEPRLVIPLSLSYDHRIIDGADGVRFLRWIAQSLENPFMLVFEGEK